MKNLAYNVAYLGGLWYTLIGAPCIDTLDNEIKTAFLVAEVTGAWWCPWSSKPVWG